jgi:SAM-dependent methyltransferase
MRPNAAVLNAEHWDAQYRAEYLPWETGRPSTELRRVVAQHAIRPCRAVELGCGTGASAVWLARRGFEVTGIDLSRSAIRRARERAARAGVWVRFRAADLTAPGVLRGPYDFFFDCGCYHAVRLSDAAAYLRALAAATLPGALGLVLLGNAAEPEDETGPPVVTEREIRAEWGARPFQIVQLRPFRFDARKGAKRYLGWSCLVRRQEHKPTRGNGWARITR